MNVKKISEAVLVFAAVFSANAIAATCAEYPYSFGMGPSEPNDGPANWKLIATGSADVQFDDVSSVNNARSEATMEAKAQLVKFINETASSEEKMATVTNQIVAKQKNANGDSKDVTETTVKESIKKLASSASFTLRGALVIGDCYTPGKEYRVTVGIKPQTIQTAGNLAGSINQSLSSTPTATGSQQQSQSGASGAQGNSSQQNPNRQGAPLNNTPGFSNSQNLGKF